MLKNVNKLQSEELLTIFSKNDILFLTETWLGDEANVQVNGFKYYQLNRTLRKRNVKRDSGGLIVYIREELVTDNTLFFYGQ